MPLIIYFPHVSEVLYRTGLFLENWQTKLCIQHKILYKMTLSKHFRTYSKEDNWAFWIQNSTKEKTCECLQLYFSRKILFMKPCTHKNETQFPFFSKGKLRKPTTKLSWSIQTQKTHISKKTRWATWSILVDVTDMPLSKINLMLYATLCYNHYLYLILIKVADRDN